ncbi:MAG: heavy metal translocating P-type ATPase [Desulfohalobiaceae bacterium]|nr:heavy metal translocating P-type ATPase [Desulfohalobiaceae bacterium]
MKTEQTDEREETPQFAEESRGQRQQRAGPEDAATGCSSAAPVNESLKENETTGKGSTVSFILEGMSCVSCARRVERALTDLPGVKAARVDFADREAEVVVDEDLADYDDLRAAAAAQGYGLLDKSTQGAQNGSGLPMVLKPILVGAVTSLCVAGFYLGLLTLTSDWYFARLEFERYGIWIVALALGLGLQVLLFSLHRAWHRGRSTRAANFSLAASGGMSTSAMAACCAHYLTLILPALGLPFLSAAAASIAQYQVYFFMAGVASNLFGIGVMLRMMYRCGMIRLRFSLNRFPIYSGSQ